MGASALQIQWRIPTWFSDLSEPTLTLLSSFNTKLIQGNKVLGMIPSTTVASGDLIHFSDAISASRLIASHNTVAEIFDFGSGGGLPGIVFAILFPKTRVKLVELDKRKAEFLSSVVTELKLPNVDVLNVNVADLSAGSVKFAMARGFAPITKSLLLTRNIFSNDGCFYHIKGDEWAREIAEIPSQLCSHWTPSLVGEYKLPMGSSKFAIVVTQKTS